MSKRHSTPRANNTARHASLSIAITVGNRFLKRFFHGSRRHSGVPRNSEAICLARDGDKSKNTRYGHVFQIRNHIWVIPHTKVDTIANASPAIPSVLPFTCNAHQLAETKIKSFALSSICLGTSPPAAAIMRDLYSPPAATAAQLATSHLWLATDSTECKTKVTHPKHITATSKRWHGSESNILPARPRCFSLKSLTAWTSAWAPAACCKYRGSISTSACSASRGCASLS